LIDAPQKGLLGSHSQFKVLEWCHDGTSALAAIRKHRPNIAVVDHSMPDLSGLAILTMLAAEQSTCRIILLTASMPDDELFRAMEAGAAGIILKETAPDTLLECLHEVAAGRQWAPHPFVEEAVHREERRRVAGRALAESLTPRQREVLLLAALNHSNKEIARKLVISEGTVKLHMQSVYEKLGVSRRSKLADLAKRYKDQLGGAATVDGE
jgi:two-component system, NarL family, nitrate/nitrite response regulator NarL